MNKLKNKKLQFLIIPMIILTICTSCILLFETKKQYKEVSTVTNNAIATIIGTLKEKYPDIELKDIIKVLNSEDEDKSSQFEFGKTELFKYGIDIDEIESIITVQNQMEQNLRINIIIIIIFSSFWLILFFVYLNRRDKRLKDITNYIYEIKNKNYQLDIIENSEDELSNLKNELYKITVMLKEESENSRKDKEKLKISVEDITSNKNTFNIYINND